MRIVILLCVLIAIPTLVAGAEKEIRIQNNFGYTVVDVPGAMEVPEFQDGFERGLVEWNQFNYNGAVQLFFDPAQESTYGLEVGLARLYYWEERYSPPVGDTTWDWGTIWTWRVGGLWQRQLTPDYYFMTGAALHVFMNDTGATIGFPLAIGHRIAASESLTIPVEIRMDVVFGNAVPVCIGAGLGLEFDLK